MRIPIRTKLVTAFALIVTLMIALALYSMSESQQSLEESVGKNSVFLAEEMLKGINQGIYLKIGELQTHSRHLVLRKSVSESNRKFQKLADIEAYINQKDSEWVSAPKDEITPFMQELISGDLSDHLREDLIEFYQEKYGYKTIVEIFVTNRYGANIAQSGKTSDYRQDDEKWWQIAREKGCYVSAVEYDESAGETAVSMGVRIDDKGGDFIGVMKAVVAVKSIVRSEEIAVKKYETTRITMITNEGKLIYRTGVFKFLENVSDKTFFKQFKGEKGFFIAKAGGRERLYSYARSKGYRAFEGLRWILVVRHDVQEILKPVFKLRNKMIVASFILIIIVIIIALAMASSITKPIAMLTKGTEIIVKGDLDHRVEVKTKDEIGVLANTFNNMIAELKNVTASRDELNKEIDERKQMEERVEHLNVVLRAIRNVNQLFTKEKDRDRLIKSACEIFTKIRGYHNAWIALFDKSRKTTAWAEAGLSSDFIPMEEMLKRGELPDCAKRVLRHGELAVIINPLSECASCPLRSKYSGRMGMCVRLKNGNEPFGILVVSISRKLADDKEEQNLFEEAAGDIAFALHSIELEEKHQLSDKNLRESEKKYGTLTQNINMGIFRTNPAGKGRLIEANPAAIKIFGYDDREEFIKQSDSVLYKHAEDRDRVIKEVSARGFVQNTEVTFKKKSGTELIGSLSIVAVKDQTGHVKHLDGIIEDVTEQKKLEEKFLQSQKMEAIGTLAGGVAHDFNNLLTTIIGSTELALMDLSRDDPLREVLEEIEKAGERAASLTRQLLAFSRKQVIQPRVLDLNQVIQETEKMLKRLIGEDIELCTVLEPELSKVKADPGQMDQVIMNLAVNARDAMPLGGMLTIETANVELDAEYFQARAVEEHPGPYVMLAVSDTGIGMDKETQCHIFEPFFTTKQKGEGTGLGLSTVYGIIKQSGGFVWAYSEPGKGTAFKIYLHRFGGDAESRETEKTTVKGLGGSETILVVEDDDAVRVLATKVLQRYGYRVLEAKEGEEALRVNEEHEGPIHLMLTDVVMPGMGGRELAERILPLHRGIRVIYMSGYTGNAIARHGFLEPGLEFIKKPFTPEGLAKKVREVLDK